MKRLRRIDRRILIKSIVETMNLPKGKKTYNYFTKHQLIELNLKVKNYAKTISA